MTDVTPEDAAAELLRRRKARTSLYDFVKQAWPQVEAGRAFVDNWHIGAKCEHLEALLRGQIKNLLINEPPREAKSTICNVMFFAWAWIEFPELSWLFSSFSFNLSIRDSRRCRSLINSQWYRTRYGGSFSLLEDANRLDRFDNNKGGYRISTSIDSQIMGDGGDIIVCDDPNNTRDRSDNMLESTLDWWQNVMPTRVNDWRSIRRLNIQQRTHERDLSGHIIANDKDNSWVKLILPMEFEAKRRCITVVLPSSAPHRWRDPRTTEGEILNKNRIGPKELAQLKRDLGSTYNVSGQLQQRPAPEQGGIIKKSWFRIWTQSNLPVCEMTIMSVDTALTADKDSAFNAATTWGVFKDEHNVPNVVLLSLWRERCEYPELRDRIKRMSQDYLDDGPQPRRSGVVRKPDVLLIEAKVSGISLIQDLSRAGIIATKFDPSKLGDKLQRVRMITPILEAGRVWLPAKPGFPDQLRPYADLFREQCASFPNAESRDLVDTATMALWRLQTSGFIWHRDDPGPAPEYSRVGNEKRPTYGA